jgi:hypothetical protein
MKIDEVPRAPQATDTSNYYYGFTRTFRTYKFIFENKSQVRHPSYDPRDRTRVGSARTWSRMLTELRARSPVPCQLAHPSESAAPTTPFAFYLRRGGAPTLQESGDKAGAGNIRHVLVLTLPTSSLLTLAPNSVAGCFLVLSLADL